MRVGIIGAGPSGSYLAYLLAGQGKRVLLLDKAASREKPCGGGVTYKALARFQFLLEPKVRKTNIRRIRFHNASGGSFDLPLSDPLFIFSRLELDSFIRQMAVSAGAEFVMDEAIDLAEDGGGWTIRTRSGAHRVDFLVGADGSKSSVRSKLVGKLAREDLSITLGYYVAGEFHQDVAIVKFLPGGYLWSFPRCDHLSVGIICDLARAKSAQMRSHLDAFVRENYPDIDGGQLSFFSALVPTLTTRGWRKNRILGSGWALVGDAAGFADPITGEGIYYALRSAELLATAFAADDPARYLAMCEREFEGEFKRAARFKEILGLALFPAISRILLASRHSRTLQLLENDYVAGKLGYDSLVRELARRSARIICEALRSF